MTGRRWGAALLVALGLGACSPAQERVSGSVRYRLGGAAGEISPLYDACWTSAVQATEEGAAAWTRRHGRPLQWTASATRDDASAASSGRAGVTSGEIAAAGGDLDCELTLSRISENAERFLEVGLTVRCQVERDFEDELAIYAPLVLERVLRTVLLAADRSARDLPGALRLEFTEQVSPRLAPEWLGSLGGEDGQ